MQQAPRCEDGLFKLLQEKEFMAMQQASSAASCVASHLGIDAGKRAELIEWLRRLARKHRLQPETLFLSVSLLDRFLEVSEKQVAHLQLVGVTAMIIAAKFHEVSKDEEFDEPPQVYALMRERGAAHSKRDVVNLECVMLNKLGFRLCQPTAYGYLFWFKQTCILGRSNEFEDLDELVQHMLELALVDGAMLKSYRASHQAAAAVLLANKLFWRTPAWPLAAVEQTGFSEKTLLPCMGDFYSLLQCSSLRADDGSAALRPLRRYFLAWLETRTYLRHMNFKDSEDATSTGPMSVEHAGCKWRRFILWRSGAPVLVRWLRG